MSSLDGLVKSLVTILTGGAGQGIQKLASTVHPAIQTPSPAAKSATSGNSNDFWTTWNKQQQQLNGMQGQIDTMYQQPVAPGSSMTNKDFLSWLSNRGNGASPVSGGTSGMIAQGPNGPMQAAPPAVARQARGAIAMRAPILQQSVFPTVSPMDKKKKKPTYLDQVFTPEPVGQPSA